MVARFYTAEWEKDEKRSNTDEINREIRRGRFPFCWSQENYPEPKLKPKIGTSRLGWLVCFRFLERRVCKYVLDCDDIILIFFFATFQLCLCQSLLSFCIPLNFLNNYGLKMTWTCRLVGMALTNYICLCAVLFLFSHVFLPVMYLNKRVLHYMSPRYTPWWRSYSLPSSLFTSSYECSTIFCLFIFTLYKIAVLIRIKIPPFL